MSSGILCLALAAAAAAPWEDGRYSWPIVPPTAMDFRIEQALREPVELDLNGTTLREAAELLQARFEIPIRLNQVALEDVGIDESTPVTVTRRGLSLASTVDQLLEPLEAGYYVEAESLVITSASDAAIASTTRIYDVTRLIKTFGDESDFESLESVIVSTIAPDSWDENGGDGAIEPYQLGGMFLLVVSQTREVQLGVDNLLSRRRSVTGAQALMSRCRAHSKARAPRTSIPRNIAPMEPGRYSWPIRPPSAIEARIEQALKEIVEIEFNEATLQEVADQLGLRFGIPIEINWSALEDEGVDATSRSTLTCRGIRLESALAHLLDPLASTYDVDSDALVITSVTDAESMETARIYDVGGIVETHDGTADFVSLIDVITSVIEPDSWPEGTGQGGPIEALQRDGAMLLLIPQTRAVHLKIEGLLEQLRRIAGLDTAAPRFGDRGSVRSARPSRERFTGRNYAESPDWFLPRVHD